MLRKGYNNSLFIHPSRHRIGTSFQSPAIHLNPGSTGRVKQGSDDGGSDDISFVCSSRAEGKLQIEIIHLTKSK